MRKTKVMSIDSPMLITTEMLQNYLSCGRPTAVKVGEQAEAKVKIGKRVLWNKPKIEKYLNSIAT